MNEPFLRSPFDAVMWCVPKKSPSLLSDGREVFIVLTFVWLISGCAVYLCSQSDSNNRLMKWMRLNTRGSRGILFDCHRKLTRPYCYWGLDWRSAGSVGPASPPRQRWWRSDRRWLQLTRWRGGRAMRRQSSPRLIWELARPNAPRRSGPNRSTW